MPVRGSYSGSHRVSVVQVVVVNLVVRNPRGVERPSDAPAVRSPTVREDDEVVFGDDRGELGRHGVRGVRRLNAAPTHVF